MTSNFPNCTSPTLMFGEPRGCWPDASLGASSNWAIKTKATPLGFTIVPHRRGTSPRLAKPGQDQALKQVIHDDGLETRDGAAAILIRVFGQQAENIARLTWDDVTVTEELAPFNSGLSIALPVDRLPSAGPLI